MSRKGFEESSLVLRSGPFGIPCGSMSRRRCTFSPRSVVTDVSPCCIGWDRGGGCSAADYSLTSPKKRSHSAHEHLLGP